MSLYTHWVIKKPSAGKDTGEGQGRWARHHLPAAGKTKVFCHCGNRGVAPQKAKYRISVGPSDSTLDIYPKGLKTGIQPVCSWVLIAK